jgi:hypothetical protein
MHSLALVAMPLCWLLNALVPAHVSDSLGQVAGSHIGCWQASGKQQHVLDMVHLLVLCRKH